MNKLSLIAAGILVLSAGAANAAPPVKQECSRVAPFFQPAMPADKFKKAMAATGFEAISEYLGASIDVACNAAREGTSTTLSIGEQYSPFIVSGRAKISKGMCFIAEISVSKCKP